VSEGEGPQEAKRDVSRKGIDGQRDDDCTWTDIVKCAEKIQLTMSASYS
jgi:hypothetical protein